MKVEKRLRVETGLKINERRAGVQKANCRRLVNLIGDEERSEIDKVSGKIPKNTMIRFHGLGLKTISWAMILSLFFNHGTERTRLTMPSNLVAAVLPAFRSCR
jgi:hypothetical protein